MSIVKTNLRNTREAAKLIRYAQDGTLIATNVQDAINEMSSNLQDAIDEIRPYVNNVRVIGSGPAIVQSTDQVLLVVRDASPASTQVQLPDLTTWGGTDLTFKDGSNNASVYPINLLPYSSQKVDGQNSSTLPNGYFSLNGDGASLNIRPLPDKSGWMTGVGGGGVGAVSAVAPGPIDTVSTGASFRGNPDSLTAPTVDVLFPNLAPLGTIDPVNDLVLVWDASTNTLRRLALGQIVATGGVSSLGGQAGALTLASGALPNTVLKVQEADMTLSDVTTLNASPTRHGFVPKLPNNTTTYFRADGTFATPPGGGGSAGVSSIDSATGDLTLSGGLARVSQDLRLASMPDGTAKARLLGSGTGTPVDASPAQMRALMDVPNQAAIASKLDDANNIVTLAHLQDFPPGRVLGRVASGTGDPQFLDTFNMMDFLGFVFGTNAAYGYARLGINSALPNGFVVQWGSNSGETSITFPVAFPNAAVAVVGNVIGSSTTAIYSFVATSINRFGFTARPRFFDPPSTSGTPGEAYCWLAVGI